MIERHCDRSTDTRNVHDVSHARGFIRSPSAQKMIQGFLNRKEQNRFINPDEAVSLGVQELAAGGMPMKLSEQRKVHTCFCSGHIHQTTQSATQQFARRKGKRLFLLLRSEVPLLASQPFFFCRRVSQPLFWHEAFFLNGTLLISHVSIVLVRLTSHQQLDMR